MGHYTELVGSFELKQEVPPYVVQALRFMCEPNVARIPDAGPWEDLNDAGRMRYMLVCDSYYFAGDTRSTVRFDEIAKAWMVTIRCNLKNYEREIERFIAWVTPYIAADDGDFIGYMRHEEDEVPILIYQPGRFIKPIVQGID